MFIKLEVACTDPPTNKCAIADHLVVLAYGARYSGVAVLAMNFTPELIENGVE